MRWADTLREVMVKRSSLAKPPNTQVRICSHVLKADTTAHTLLLCTIYA